MATGCSEPLQRLPSQGRQIEGRLDELLRAVGDDDLSRLRQVLQARGNVGRGADHRGFLRGALADQASHHHQPGGDAGARGQRLAIAGPQLADGGDRGHGGANRPLGLVLMSLRPAEIGQHAVTHELRDVTVEARDLAGNRILVAPDDLAHLFRIALRGQRRRTDEVDEQYRQLAALGGIDGRVGVGRRWRGEGAGDGLEQPASRAERDAETPEIVLREVRQNVDVDLLRGENGVQRAEPASVQPVGEGAHRAIRRRARAGDRRRGRRRPNWR